jgi:unsaturated rhamnogalacturonyl hydrolase
LPVSFGRGPETHRRTGFRSWSLSAAAASLLGEWNYKAAFYLYGQYQVFRRTKVPHYLRYIRNWVDQHVDEAGEINQPLDALDRFLPGLLLIELYRQIRHDKYKRALATTRRELNRFPVRWTEGSGMQRR